MKYLTYSSEEPQNLDWHTSSPLSKDASSTYPVCWHIVSFGASSLRDVQCPLQLTLSLYMVGTEIHASYRWITDAIELNRHTTCVKICGSVVCSSFIFLIRQSIK